MQSRVQKWGTSLAVRIAMSFALEAGRDVGAVVDLAFVDGKLIVTPRPERLSLEKLLAGITPENRHDEHDFGGFTLFSTVILHRRLGSP